MATTTLPGTKQRRDWSDHLSLLGFIVPGAALLIIFLVVPFAQAIGYSFTNLRLISPLQPHAVGWQNYLRLLSDPLVRQAFGNTLLFAMIIVPAQTALALWLAILVNQRIRGIKVFRVIFFAPVVTVMAAAATIWKLLYAPDSGLIDAFTNFVTFGHFHPNWLHDPHFALLAIVIVSLWQGLGFQMVILLAALQDIPLELYEASSLDGAGRWAQFVAVTLPQLRNTLIFVGTITTILAFRLFDQVFVMTQGGPLGATETVITQINTIGFAQQKIGEASALAVMFFLLVLAINLTQRFFIREEGEIA